MATQRSLEMLSIAADVIEEQGDHDLAAVLRKWSEGAEFWVIWEHDPDADLSYLDQDEFADVDPEDIVSLQATVWRRWFWDVKPGHPPHLAGIRQNDGWELMTSLAGIDFNVDEYTTTGTFSPEEAIELQNEYQREVSKELLEEAGYECP